MLALLKRLIQFVFGPSIVPSDDVKPLPKVRAKKADAVDEESGEFYFRETILDQLDYYMKCLARMRRGDPESFDTYSQVGGHIIPETALKWFGGLGAFKHETPKLPQGDKELSPWFRTTLPAFGAIFIGKIARDIESKEDVWVPRFFYFTKYEPSKAPPEIQRVSKAMGTVYLATIYWDDVEQKLKWKRKNGTPQQFPILIKPDGSVGLLRSLVPNTKQIRHKVGKYRGRTFVVPNRQWMRGDPWLTTWAAEFGEDVETYLTSIFIQVANMYETANSSIIRVTASDGDLSASFGVNIKRTPYFFSDREVNLTESGRRKRIFHIVRPHTRQSGKAVKLHFRGEKNFLWNRYSIQITVPGRDHLHISEFSVPASDERKMKPGVKAYDTKEIAAELKGHMQGKPFFKTTFFKRTA